ncbi:MAG: phospho-sugar mutase [Clostridia bacterium]|nr:phospho-sugar mutase [Clostridia bacterium]
MNYLDEYRKWCTSAVFDKDTQNELLTLTDEKEIEDRFYKQLSFGTGGLRGIIGAGTNRMNIYTVGKASQGLADFINTQTKNGSVVIAYDSRRMSKEFALDSALIFAANGIKAYLFESLRPTPELSFAVRELKATAGIVITASHNPPQYNGYKVYWSDGGQIVAPYDKLIIGEVNKIDDYDFIKRIEKEKAEKSGLLKIIGKEIDDKYIAALKNLVLNREVLNIFAKEIKIVYTPLNGTGNLPVRRVLEELGFENVWVVPEQEAPDGNFPTLEYPNPEDKKAFAYALALAKKMDADLVLATDPDADRLGIYAKDTSSGEYMPFTGNMSGLLIAEYELSQKREKGLLPQNPKNGALVTTIVSSKMAYDIAAEYGLTVKEVLTGFKYIGEQIKLFEEAKEKNGGKLDCQKGALEYEFGYEESYGCLVGTHARDKDAVVAVMALCEAAAYYRSKGLTLWDQMQNIYQKYGYYVEDLKSVTLRGAEGAAHIEKIMEQLREEPPKSLGGLRVLAVRDYSLSLRKDCLSGSQNAIELPKSNVLYFELENNGWACVRPSGTEPKIKFYFGVKGKNRKEAEESIRRVQENLIGLANAE